MNAHTAVLGGAIQVNPTPGTAQGADLPAAFWSTALERDSAQINSLCYNAANMRNPLRFTDDNNNDLPIVGRSLAG